MNKINKGFRWQNDTLLLNIYVQPNARHEGFDGLHDQSIKLRISAPASDGKANRRLIAILVDIFKVPRRSIELLKGEKSRQKVVAIKNPGSLPDWISG